MDFFDYAWTTSFQITRKKHEDVKVLVRDDFTFPVLGKIEQGYVICLPEPRNVGKNKVNFQGMRLNVGNELQKRVLWQLFRASVVHLSQHVATSGYDAYAMWSRRKDPKLALYVANAIEDSAVAACVEKLWSPFLPDLALANAIAYLRLRPAQTLSDDSVRVMTAVNSQSTIGKVKGVLPKEMQRDAMEIASQLEEIKDIEAKRLESEGKEANRLTEAEVLERKLELADEIYQRLRKYGKPPSIPTPPHAENYGGVSVYRNSVVATREEFDNALKAAFFSLGCDPFSDDSYERETTQVFSEWKVRRERESKILARYQEAMENTRFSAIGFPKEDYTEYLRSKQLLSSPVRRVLEKLRLLKNIAGEDFKHESGFIDLQEAVQVVASQSRRTDIFVREELQTREEAWAIVIDASHSLSFFTGEVRGVALCLGETAKNLILDRTAWGMFAFNDKFFILKDFSENYSTRIRARIGGLKHGGLTYLPDGLAVVKTMLQRHIEEAKIIIVVSDFFPAGDGCIEDKLKQSVKQLERAGYGLIGVGLRSRAVRDYFRVSCVIDTPYDLMKKFVKAFLEYSSTV